MPASRVDIDLSAIDRNLALIRRVIAPEGTQTASKVGVCAVLKQDAYGAGAVRIAKRLIGSTGTGVAGPAPSAPAAGGIDMIAVYGLDEARQIAEAVPTVPILILMPVHGVDRMDPLYRHAAVGRLHLTLHGMDQLAGVEEMAGRIGAAVPVHVQVDTGLSRGGVMPEHAAKLVERVAISQKIRLGGLMTHFASPCCDDQATRDQARLFREFVETIKPTIKAAVDKGGKAVSKVSELAVHAANSCAMFRSRSYHGTMVRVGQSVLGYCGYEVPGREHFEFRQPMNDLTPAVRWLSSIVHVEEIPAGWPVGYGGAWRAPLRADGRATRIAIVPVGYADGYPRALGGRGAGGPGVVGLTGRIFERRGGGDDDAASTTMPTVYAPVVGRVSMDQITIDVTEVPEPYLRSGRAGNEPAGPEVEIYGRSPGAPNELPALAEAAGTITHDLLTRISSRVERTYRAPMVSTSTESPSSAMRIQSVSRGGGIAGATAVAQ